MKINQTNKRKSQPISTFLVCWTIVFTVKIDYMNNVNTQKKRRGYLVVVSHIKVKKLLIIKIISLITSIKWQLKRMPPITFRNWDVTWCRHLIKKIILIYFMLSKLKFPNWGKSWKNRQLFYFCVPWFTNIKKRATIIRNFILIKYNTFFSWV